MISSLVIHKINRAIEPLVRAMKLDRQYTGSLLEKGDTVGVVSRKGLKTRDTIIDESTLLPDVSEDMAAIGGIGKAMMAIGYSEKPEFFIFNVVGSEDGKELTMLFKVGRYIL